MTGLPHSNTRIRRALAILDDHTERTERLYERRREHSRRPVQTHVQMIAQGQNAGSPINAWTYDVSRSGLGIVCEQPLELGPLRICLSPDGTDRLWMDAVVQHCKEVADEIYACGVEFTRRLDLLSKSASTG